MKFLALLILTIFSFVMLSVAQEATKPVGQTTFVDNKCIACHSINSLKIESKKATPIDLSLIGETLQKDFLKKYLVQTEPLKEKKHPIKFKGTEKELEEMVGWLIDMKTK